MLFFFNYPAPSEIYSYRHTLSLNDALPSSACFTLALSFGLARAGYNGDTLETGAAVTLEQQDGGFTITKSALTLTGKVPGIAAAEFARIAEEDEKNCPVSKLLDCEITLEHTLEGQAAQRRRPGSAPSLKSNPPPPGPASLHRCRTRPPPGPPRPHPGR